MCREQRDELVPPAACQVLERPGDDHGALALGDVRAEVLALRLGVTHQVEQVILELEGKAGVHAKAPERLHLLIGAPTADGSDGER